MGKTDVFTQINLKMKALLLSLDKFISEAGEAFAMLLIFGGLTILNTLSILHLYAEISVFTVTMSALLGVAISMTTITIVRAQREKYPELKTHLKVLKIIYPVFDAVLVYDGFNISEINKTAMSVIFAALLGLSMYALGMLNLHKRKTEMETSETEIASADAENSKPKTVSAAIAQESENSEKSRIIEHARTMLGGEISREAMTRNYESQNKFIMALIERSGTSYSKSTVQNLISNQ